MARRPRSTALTALATVGLLVAGPAVAAPTPPRTAASDPGAIEDELSRAESELAATTAAIDRADASLHDARARVAAATAALTAVEDELELARDAQAAAAREERAAATEIAVANTTLDETVAAHDSSRSQLRRRAVRAFKHGPALPEATLLQGITSSSDWHEVAITIEAVSRMLARDQDLVERRGEVTRQLAAGRTQVVASRQEAVRTARHTTREARRVEHLVDRRQRALAGLARERTELTTLRTELEADAELRTALVQRLRSELARVQLAASTVLVPVAAELDLDGPVPAWADRLPGAGRPWAARIDAIARSRGVDGRLLAALVWTESNFRPDAVSHAGAIGMAQLMPGTAAGLGVDPWDATHNLDGGTRYLRTQLTRFGRVDLALAAYNAGPHRVQRAGPGIPNIVETQLYVVRVLERYHALSG